MKGPNERAETRQTINPRRVTCSKLKLLHFRDPSARSKRITVTVASAEGDKAFHANSELLVPI